MNNKLVKVFWNDAVIYKEPPQRLKLAKKMTRGELVKETKYFVIIKDPITSDYSEKEKIYVPKSDSKHTFFFIPKGMTEKIIKAR